MPLPRRALCLASLSTLTFAHAQPAPPASAASADAIRELLQDKDGSLSELAKSTLGSTGGNRLFYFPTRDEPTTPADWGLKFESVRFKSGDGTPLHGWFIPGKNPKPKGTVVFSHGNAGSISYHIGFCAWFAEAGYNVLMYDYRGFGKSGGEPDRRGMINDVKAAFSYIMKRPDVDGQRVISYGHSLGGAQSITALAESPVKGLRAIIIDGAFASYQAMARVIGGQLGASLVSDELAPKDFVKKLTPVPFLVVHGARDEVVPVSQGRLLYQSAGQPKTLFEVEGGRHGTALSDDNGAYRKRTLEWMARTLGG